VKPPASPPTASMPYCYTETTPPAPCCVVGPGACQSTQGGMGGGGAVVVP
jgi:hypothetical protein